MLVFLTFFNAVFSESLLNTSSDRLTISEEISEDVERDVVQLRFNFFLPDDDDDSSPRSRLLAVDLDVLDEPLVDASGSSEFLACTSLTTESDNCLTTTLGARNLGGRHSGGSAPAAAGSFIHRCGGHTLVSLTMELLPRAGLFQPP
jgi:hypothetical protein